MTESPFQIAIDGPVAAGKGTISRLVAQRLGFLYVDTGAMYRVSAYLALKNGIKWEDEDGVSSIVNDTDIQMHNPQGEEQDGRLITVLVNGDDVSWKIRTEEIGRGAGVVAQHPHVRTILVKKQQVIAAKQDVVMEGRDITYRVLPNADLKIYLTGSDIVRAKRRHLEQQSKGIDVSFEQVYEDLVLRDQRDMNRAVDPLHIVEDAWVIDTSDLSIEQVVDAISGKVKAMQEVSGGE